MAQPFAAAVVEVDVRDLDLRRQRGRIDREVVVVGADLHPVNEGLAFGTGCGKFLITTFFS